MGYSTSVNIDRELVLAALRTALEARGEVQALMGHSDRGSPYASGDYQEMLKAAGIRCSMSRRANCWDSAVAFGTLTSETVEQYETRAEARAAITDSIDGFYNLVARPQLP